MIYNEALQWIGVKLLRLPGTKWGLRQYLKMDRLEEQTGNWQRKEKTS